jgi:hypothetical protein
MYKIGLSLILLLSVSLLPFNLYAQSGRKTSEPKPTKSEKPDDGITESTVNPNGETVEGDVIRFDTALVMVPVTVTDRSGGYVPQLRRDQFRITENGVEQKIAFFATTDAPFSVVLLIDTSGSTNFRLEIQDGQAFTWIAEELGRQYSLGYYPSTPGKDGERRQINVKVTESDLVVKSRDSYIYSEKGKTTRLTEE